MAGSINTASLLLVAMLVSTVLAFPVLSEDPQLASSFVSYPSVTASQLGDVQDITATDDGSLETAALGKKGKQQERVKAHSSKHQDSPSTMPLAEDNEEAPSSGDSHKHGHHSHHKAGSTHSKTHKDASKAQASQASDLFGETHTTASTEPSTDGSHRRHSHSSRRHNRRHRAGEGGTSVADTMGKLWPDLDVDENDGQGPGIYGNIDNEVNHDGDSSSNGDGYGDGDGDNYSSRYGDNGGSRAYKGDGSEDDSIQGDTEDKDYSYGDPSPTQPGRKHHQPGRSQRPHESHLKKGNKHSDQTYADEVTGSQNRSEKLWDYGWNHPTAHHAGKQAA